MKMNGAACNCFKKDCYGSELYFYMTNNKTFKPFPGCPCELTCASSSNHGSVTFHYSGCITAPIFFYKESNKSYFHSAILSIWKKHLQKVDFWWSMIREFKILLFIILCIYDMDYGFDWSKKKGVWFRFYCSICNVFLAWTYWDRMRLSIFKQYDLSVVVLVVPLSASRHATWPFSFISCLPGICKIKASSASLWVETIHASPRGK
jgi:hypothetical protein